MARLERLGDLRPSNVLLDARNHLKLVGFDSASAIGAAYAGGQVPYARILGKEAAQEDRGSFGYHGARTEQFAIGSIVYIMTRGYELYDDQSCRGEQDVVLLLQKKLFPVMSQHKVDMVINIC